MEVHDVIVLGGGLSGLSAATLLYNAGVKKVLVLEAKDRVGGRTFTKRSEKVDWVDLGGAYVGPTQDRIQSLIKRLNLETYAVNNEGQLVNYYFGKRSVHECTGVIYRAPGSSEQAELDDLISKIDELAEEVPSDCPWNCPQAKEWDTITAMEFINKTCKTSKARKMARLMTKGILTAAPEEVSLLFLLWYIKSGSGVDVILSNVNGAQDQKVMGGTMQISEKLAEKLGDKRVLLNKPVYYIDQTKDVVVTKTIDGSRYASKYVVVAFAPTLHQKIHFKPPLPALRNQMIQRFPMGSCIKCIAYYETPFWREKGLCGSGTIAAGDEHPIEEFIDDTKHNGSFPAIMGFSLAEKARKFSELSKEQRKQAYCESLAKVLDSELALSPVHYEDYDWNVDPYSGGAYTGICPPGLISNFGKIFREPVGKIHFAGTETARQWVGYMDGAVEAGERAALEVLTKMTNCNNGTAQAEKSFGHKQHKEISAFQTLDINSTVECLKTMKLH